jgi:D-glycero-D-manno-heptose 1,7-bisphosphate phosphatase
VNSYSTVLLDRDGVINRMRTDYVKSWDDFELLPGALEAIGRLGRSGLEVIVLTNQSAIAQKLVTAQAVDEVHSRLAAMVIEHGGRIRAFLICPHSRDEGCSCRKPAPGLFFRARDELGVELADAIMVGDQIWDIEAARAAGCEAILVDPNGSEASLDGIVNCRVVRNLGEAVEIICDQH